MPGPEAPPEAPPPAPPMTPEAPAAEAPAPAAADEFKVDEAQLASLPPEIRQTVVDPLLDKFKGYTLERVKREQTSLAKKYELDLQKSKALEQLAQNPAFQKWYVDQQAIQRGVPPKVPGPSGGITPEEWTNAYEQAAQGDLAAVNALQEKQLDTLVIHKYAPVINQVQAKTKEFELTMEMNHLFKA